MPYSDIYLIIIKFHRRSQVLKFKGIFRNGKCILVYEVQCMRQVHAFGSRNNYESFIDKQIKETRSLRFPSGLTWVHTVGTRRKY